MTFKDPCNLRSPQQHVGVVHSSNLCTEITLNTSAQEIAVCNLGSVNLANHTDEPRGWIGRRLRKTIQTAMRMLDNVIDINFYTVPEARAFRTFGIGLWGWESWVIRMRFTGCGFRLPRLKLYVSRMRAWSAMSYEAISASVDLAEERGRYAERSKARCGRGEYCRY